MERIGMNERILELYKQAQVPDTAIDPSNNMPYETTRFSADKFAELIMKDMHKKVIASILITDVVMEEKGQVPTSEDYIRAINKDFGVK
jgi:4-aminobutyrate aminotransferase-like enzyme